MEHVIVERTLSEPLTAERLEQMRCSAERCYGLYRVRRIRSFISADGKRAICEYEAPDAESVRRANLSAGFPFESIWTASVLDAEF